MFLSNKYFTLILKLRGTTYATYARQYAKKKKKHAIGTRQSMLENCAQLSSYIFSMTEISKHISPMKFH